MNEKTHAKVCGPKTSGSKSMNKFWALDQIGMIRLIQ